MQYIPIKIMETLRAREPLVKYIGMQIPSQQIINKKIDTIGCFFFIKREILMIPHIIPIKNSNANIIKIMNIACSMRCLPF